MATAAELRSLLADVAYREDVADAYGGASIRNLFGVSSIDFSTASDPGKEWQEYFAPVFREQEQQMAELHQQFLKERAALLDDPTLPDLSIVGSPRPGRIAPASSSQPRTVTRA